MTAVVVANDERNAQPATTPILLATIRAARDGSNEAFEELMIATERRVALLAWRILGDAEEVKEAVQETFIRVYRHLRRYDERHDFVGWLYRIAVNVCRDLDRHRKRRHIFTTIDEALPMASGDDDAAFALERQQDRALLARGIDALPPKERLALILRDIEGLPADEVAAILGSSASTVRVQIHNARARLRKWIEEWRR